MEGHWNCQGGGWGVLKAKFLEAMYEDKLDFPGGWEAAKQKTFRGGGELWIFSVLYICHFGPTCKFSQLFFSIYM